MVVAYTFEVGMTLAPFISVSRIYVWYMEDLGKICKIFKCCVVNFLKIMPLGTGMKFEPVTSDCPVMLPYQQSCLFKVFKFTPQCKLIIIMDMLSPDIWSL
jgi:hypothetical protein